MPQTPTAGSRHDWHDTIVALLLFVGTVAYLAALPHNLDPSDEAVHLYDAKRVLNGGVLYRDVFNFITPGWFYLMAVLFRLFGTTIGTARVAVAIIHGLTAAVIYLTCRRFGVRRGIAWTPSFAYLVVCQSAWPIASQHWLDALLSVTLLYVCAARAREHPTWPLGPGIVLGLLMAVQQQRGIFMSVGLAGWLIARAAFQRRYPSCRPGAPLTKQLAWLCVGIAVVMVPLGIAMVGGAGFQSVWRALVVFPLVNYRLTRSAAWGEVNALTNFQSTFTFPRLLACLPAILVVDLARGVALWVRRRDPDGLTTVTLLVALGGASIVSILYFADFIHIAFIAPVLLVATAESIEWAVRLLPAPRFLRVAGVAAGAALLFGGGAHLRDNYERLWKLYHLSASTAFGRIDFADPREIQLYEKLGELLRRTPSRYLFCYPIMAHLYLMLDVENPSPYGYVVATLLGPDGVREVLDQVEAKQPPYVVALPSRFLLPDDPILAFIQQTYEPIRDDSEVAKLIYRRREAGDERR